MFKICHHLCVKYFILHVYGSGFARLLFLLFSIQLIFMFFFATLAEVIIACILSLKQKEEEISITCNLVANN